MGLLAPLNVPVKASSPAPNCSMAIEPWSTALMQDLPGYANRQFNRIGADTRMLAAGVPEIDISPALQYPGIDRPATSEDVVRVFFSTAELQRGNSSGSHTQLAYRLLLARRDADRPWQLLSLDVAAADRLAPTDITGGAIWQAIEQWQRAGCPGVKIDE